MMRIPIRGIGSVVGQEKVGHRQDRSRRALSVERLEARELLTGHIFGEIAAIRHRHAPAAHLKGGHVSAPSPALQQAEQQLASDLQMLAAEGEIPSGTIPAVNSDIAAAAAAARHGPSLSSLIALGNDYSAGEASHNFNVPQLTTDAENVFISEGVPRALAQKTANDLLPILESTTLGISQSGIIDTDLKNIILTSGTKR